MKICIFGAGYVGLVAAACFAESGNSVITVDIDHTRIDSLKQGIIPIYEPGLKEMILRNQTEGRLSFTVDMEEAVNASLVCFIAVGTPPGEDGSADLKYVLSVARDIGRTMNGFKIIVDKSTVPVGTADKVRAAVLEELAARGVELEFDVVSNPEFLKEGAAIDDFMKPDRVVIGCDNVRTAEIMKELYDPFMRKQNRMIVMDIRSAEMTKYAANAMLATRISFMNQIAGLCERMGADVMAVREGIGSDTRIGYDFLFPGPGYGGSCFPKDVKALIRTAEESNYDFLLLKAVEEVNEHQKEVLADKLIKLLGSPDEEQPAHRPHRRLLGTLLQTPHRRHARSPGHHDHRASAGSRSNCPRPRSRSDQGGPAPFRRPDRVQQQPVCNPGRRRRAGGHHRLERIPQPGLRPHQERP